MSSSFSKVESIWKKTPNVNLWPPHTCAHTHTCMHTHVAHMLHIHNKNLPWYPIITSSSRNSVWLCNLVTWRPSEKERQHCSTVTVAVTNGTVLPRGSLCPPSACLHLQDLHTTCVMLSLGYYKGATGSKPSTDTLLAPSPGSCHSCGRCFS